jgi:predicted metal-binding protein
MKSKVKIGIIICDRYKTCTGGKCLRSMREKTGAFEIYRHSDIELAGYATRGGCPGGNIEYAPEEMKQNGVQVIHFATGMLVGYPPCPWIDYFKRFIENNYELSAVTGTHPIPEKYYQAHLKLNTWNTPEWEKIIEPVLSNNKIRLFYN